MKPAEALRKVLGVRFAAALLVGCLGSGGGFGLTAAQADSNSVVYWRCTSNPTQACPANTSYPLPVTPSAPSGTQDTNLKQVNGATVNVGVGAASTGTQRVTTSTDSTIGTVTAVTAITNALPAGANIIGKVDIDQTTPGTTNGVVVNSGTVGGFEFNVGDTPTVQNAAYAAGQSLGGLQTISVSSTNSITGILSQIVVASAGGSTVGVVVYAWDKNPASTTCTDKSNFVSNATDNLHMIGIPQLLTPALSVSAQDTSTRAAATNLASPFTNGSTNTNIYVCVLANAAVTPATTTDYRIQLSGTKDQP